MRLARLTIGIFAVAGLSLLGFLIVLRRPSKEVATALLLAHPKFTTKRMAVVPRSIYVNPGVYTGEFALQSPYTATELGFIAPTVAALKALQLVDVTEYTTPADTINLPSHQQDLPDSDRREALRSRAFAHTLMVQPREALTNVAGFAEADAEPEREDAGSITVTTTPGWQFPIAVRELVEVTGVQHSPRPLRDFDATLCWRWRPLPAGELFAVGSDTYDRIPERFWDDASPVENERGRKIFFDTDLHAGLARLTRKDDRWEIVFLTRLDEVVPIERVCSDP